MSESTTLREQLEYESVGYLNFEAALSRIIDLVGGEHTAVARALLNKQRAGTKHVGRTVLYAPDMPQRIALIIIHASPDEIASILKTSNREPSPQAEVDPSMIISSKAIPLEDFQVRIRSFMVRAGLYPVSVLALLRRLAKERRKDFVDAVQTSHRTRGRKGFLYGPDSQKRLLGFVCDESVRSSFPAKHLHAVEKFCSLVGKLD